MRQISLCADHVNIHAEGACLVTLGQTRVLCTATLEDTVPRWLRGSNKGWISAEYGMLPRATHQRNTREAKRGQSGRSHEIQRLIGRSLRAAVDLRALGQIQILIDCDVLQADGGTRTAAITGGYVALRRALDSAGLTQRASLRSVCAVSCVLIGGQARIDPDYTEDSNADADANFVFSGEGSLIEVQASAEKSPFACEQFFTMLEMAKKAVPGLSKLQEDSLAAA